VRLGFGFVAIEGPSFGPLYLAPAQAGALRGALRQVMLELGRLGGPRLPNRPRDVPEPEPVQRRKLRLLRPPPPRPTVADIEAKLRGLDQLAAETTRPITVEVWPVDDETVPRIPRQRAAPVAVPVPPTDTVPTPG
jgi:hypothetical protein